MNFIDFLKNNSVVSFSTSASQNSSDKKEPENTDKSTNTKKQTNKDTNNKYTNNKDTNNKDNKDTNKHDNKDTNKNDNKKEQCDYSTEQNLHPFKKGDFVKIVKYKDSIYNYYKSYTGEIKEYNPYQNYVTVFLHPIYHAKLIQMHADHVVKI